MESISLKRNEQNRKLKNETKEPLPAQLLTRTRIKSVEVPRKDRSLFPLICCTWTGQKWEKPTAHETAPRLSLHHSHLILSQPRRRPVIMVVKWVGFYLVGCDAIAPTARLLASAAWLYSTLLASFFVVEWIRNSIRLRLVSALFSVRVPSIRCTECW